MIKQKINVLFMSSNLPASILIKACTFSEWSHVAIIDPSSPYFAIEANFFGVSLGSVAHLKKTHSKSFIKSFYVDDAHSAFEFAKKQIGRPYDYSYLFGFFLHKRNMQNDKKWACSELVYYALRAGGLKLFQDDCLWRITPDDLYKANA